MHASADVPLFAAAALGAVSASLTAFGLRRRRYPGWSWWVTAMWLTTVGTLLAGMDTGAVGTALATTLLLQWPLITLIGLRRFFARQSWPGGERGDTLLLGFATLATAFGSLLLPPDNLWLLSLIALAVHLYAAAVLFFSPGEPEATPMHGLAAVMALVAFGPGLAVVPGGMLQPLSVRAVAAALGGIVLAFVAVTLVCDRTERQLRDSRRRLRTLANLDALTQVPNRRHFAELATQALRVDPPGSATLLMFDVDHFKLINDHLGHAAGDRALCLVSASVLEHLRAHDIAGRHGGDEFVLLLRGTTTQHAMGVAARIVADVQSHALRMQLPTLSLSFGLVQVGATEDVDAALRRADQALYEAKRQGRSCVVAAEGDEEQPVFSESQRLGLTAC